MHRLCHLDDLPNHSSKGFQHEGSYLFVVRKNNTVYAYRNACPHLGIPLEWVEDQFLTRDGDLIQCSTHGALFTIDDGLCVSGPCSGQSLQSLPVEIRDRGVWLKD